MNQTKANKKIRRKIARANACPFCGMVSEFNVECREPGPVFTEPMHIAARSGCCKPTASGQTELFFSKRPNYRLLWRITSTLIDDWNRRQQFTAAA